MTRGSGLTVEGELFLRASASSLGVTRYDERLRLDSTMPIWDAMKLGFERKALVVDERNTAIVAMVGDSQRQDKCAMDGNGPMSL